MKIQELEAEVNYLRNEVNYYKKEIEKLMSTPLIEGVLLEVLPDGRAVVKSSTGPNLIVEISGSVDVSKLRSGSRVALNQRGSAVVSVLPTIEDPYVKAMEIDERPNVRYSDVGGLDEQIRELREVIELPLKNPELFKELGIEPPKGVLLYGPPGCGKTLLAKAVAGESNATFISLVSSELAQKFVGEGARIVRELFDYARKKAPSIVLIDEIDAIAAKRLDLGTSGEREIHRTLTQLLAELDGFDPLDNVKVIATTNRLDVIDPALLRPGRFDRLIYVPLPDLKGRVSIFKIHTRKMKLKDVDVEELARLTEGASGADIKAICTEAGFSALRAGRRYVSMEDFRYAIEKVLKGRFRPYAEGSDVEGRRGVHTVV
ncbi:MAG: proteasome-activating nucleotidase [Zestosphaera tikiterensis]|uniref:Proteasome-activating nucleotidase n=1 Tax=Zestosphaera tikiterensis TaxID=1973259 RepID=A0A2R7Y6G9_9CREN|nr:MAG: proteasome-activating nucleotidase [Zestosphaera tikiterensis]